MLIPEKPLLKEKLEVKVLHSLSSSLPHIAGYTIRSHQILFHLKKYIKPLAIVDRIRKDEDKNPNIIEDIPYFNLPSFPLSNEIEECYFTNALRIPNLYKSIYNKIFLPSQSTTFISNLVKIHEIDLIHGHSPAKFSKYAYKVAKKNGIPFIYEVRGFIEDTKVGLRKWNKNSKAYTKRKQEETELMKKADAIVTLGNAMKNDIISRGITSEKIFIVPNGVNINKFKPVDENQKLKKKLGLKKNHVIGYIGSIRRIEGIEVLIKSFYYLTEKIENVKLLIVGPVRPDIYLERLKNFCEKLEITKDVIFTGKVPYEQINNYYSIIDIFVIPRLNLRVNRLVTPLKPLEVMAMGKVLIASDLPALRELIKPGVSGILFEPENSKKLAKKLETCIDDEQKHKNLQKTSREYVINTFSWSKIVKRYLTIYDNLIKNL